MSEAYVPETQAQKTLRHLRRLDELLDQESDTSCTMRHEDLKRDSEGLPIIPNRGTHFEYKNQCIKKHGACPHVWEEILAVATNLLRIEIDLISKTTYDHIRRIANMLSSTDHNIRYARTRSTQPVRIDSSFIVPNLEQAQTRAQPILD